MDASLWPAICLRCVDCRPFGRDTLVGVHVVRRVRSLLVDSNDERRRRGEKQLVRTEFEWLMHAKKMFCGFRTKTD
jgi:hypothetical protein